MIIFRAVEPAPLAKAEQLSLFDMPVHVAGSVDKNGVQRAGHMARRKKKLAAPATAPTGDKLDEFIAKHGGQAHLKAEIDKMTPEQRAKLIDAMAHVGGVGHEAVMAKLEPVAGADVAPAVEPPSVEPAIKPLDHGELNVPLAQRGDIDVQLDRHKREQVAEAKKKQKSAAAEKRFDKSRARELWGELGEQIIEQHGERFGPKKLREMLDSWIKWEPKKFITFAEAFRAEQERSSSTPEQQPELAPPGEVETPVEAPAEPEQAAPAATNSDFELAEDRQDLAEEMIKNPHSDKAKELIRKIAGATAGP